MREVALQSNYETTIELLKEYPQFDNEEFWKTKCQRQFPNKYYFNSLNGKENYLVQTKDKFLLPVVEVSPNEYDYLAGSPLPPCNRSPHLKGHKVPFDNYLYEYSKILTEIVFRKNCYCYMLQPFVIENRFVVVMDDNCHCDVSIIGQYATESDAINAMKKDQSSRNNKYSNDDDKGVAIGYFIFDLEYFIPYLNTGELRPSNLTQNDHFTFHKFIIGDPIV